MLVIVPRLLDGRAAGEPHNFAARNTINWATAQLPALLTLLINSHQHRLLDNMPLHRFLDIGLAWFLQIRKNSIERVKLVEITMARSADTGRRNRCAGNRSCPPAFLRAVRSAKRLAAGPSPRADVVIAPSGPRSSAVPPDRWRRVIDDEHQALCVFRNAAPCERGETSFPGRYAVWECCLHARKGRCQLERHELSSFAWTL